MFRSCTIVAFFTARMIVAVFDLGLPSPPPGLDLNIQVKQESPRALAPTVVSGLPEDAGTLRR